MQETSGFQAVFQTGDALETHSDVFLDGWRGHVSTSQSSFTVFFLNQRQHLYMFLVEDPPAVGSDSIVYCSLASMVRYSRI